MGSDKLKISATPNLAGGRMVLAFSGWMDGGEVSTGTVSRLVEKLDAQPIAEIEPDGFYIYNFPGAMEVSAMFRPHVDIQNGLIKDFAPPKNRFYCDEEKKLAFFVGKEPNLNWQEFGDCIFNLTSQLGVNRIYFVGSFGGTVPHTREPRLYATVSDQRLLQFMRDCGVRFTNYEGPGSFVTYLMTESKCQGLEMASVVAEIPGYLQGTNPVSIEVMTRRLAAILEVPVDLSELRDVSNEWESRVSEEVEKNPELTEQVRELEERYDDDLIDASTDRTDKEPDEAGE